MYCNPTLNPKLFSKNLLTQEGQYGKIIPVADEAAPFERAMKKISKKSFDANSELFKEDDDEAMYKNPYEIRLCD